MRAERFFASLKWFATGLERYLLLWLLLSSWMAYKWPSSDASEDPFLLSRPWLPYGIAATMFAIGWLLPLAEVRQVFQRWPLVVSGTALQYASMPVIAFAVAHLFPLNDDLRMGIIMVGCVPGAMASNVLTMVARANVSYSLSLTTSATCLSPLCVPIVLRLTMNEALPVPISRVVWQLLLMVVLPVCIGFRCGLALERLRRWANQIGKIVAALAILWIIAVVVGVNRERLAMVDEVILLAVFTLNLGGYAVGQFGALLMRLPAPMGRALTLEIGMQNAGLGTALASEFFADRPAVMIPTALYTFGCMFTGTLLASFWAARRPETASPPDEAVDL